MDGTTYGGLYELRPKKPDVLYVSYLGGFDVQWNGTSLIAAAKSSETQFSYLMQMILYRPEGVNREELERFLFESRDIDNAHHALQSVVYNAKRRLSTFDLPETKYIIQEKGVFRWTSDIPVEVDVWEFERMVNLANEETDPKQQVQCYLSACGRYAGEFLPNQAGVIWAAQEARRYRSMFCACVERAAELLHEQEDYETLEKLGKYASLVDPLADWEIVTMDSYVCRDMYDAARKLYDDTVQHYLQRQGLRPSKKLMEIFAKLGDRMNHRYKVLDSIQADLTEPPKEAARGGYLCSYPIFRGIYRSVERMMERSGQSVYLMLCTVVDGKGNPMDSGSMLDELSRRLEVAICKAVRKTDIVNRYGLGQFLVLLVNTTLEDCEIAQQRITSHFIVGRQRTGVQFYVNSVIGPPSEGHTGGRRRKGKG